MADKKYKIECTLHEYIRDLPGMTIAHTYYKNGMMTDTDFLRMAADLIEKERRKAK